MEHQFQIREIKNEDRPYLLAMMMEFYMSPAVIHKPTVELLNIDIEAAFAVDIPLICYIFEVDGNIVGYSMIVKSFSTEYGLHCIWLEDLYIKPKYRRRGIGRSYFAFLKEKYPSNQYRIRLEVAKDNDSAIRFYKNNKLEEIEYLQMQFPLKDK